MKVYEFDARLIKHPKQDAAFVEFPYDVEKEFGSTGQVKVHVTFDGRPYRGSLAKMGHHCHILGVTKAIRNALGKNPGDTVHIVLKKDEAPRVVEIPDDFGSLLKQNPKAEEFFEGLSYTNRKEYVGWIMSAKKEETREQRLKRSIELLLNGVKHP